MNFICGVIMREFVFVFVFFSFSLSLKELKSSSCILSFCFVSSNIFLKKLKFFFQRLTRYKILVNLKIFLVNE